MELDLEKIRNLAPAEKSVKISSTIAATLKEQPNGLTINQIMELTKISRETVEKHLQDMLSSNEIYNKTFGQTRVYFPNNRPHYILFKSFNTSQGRTIWFDVLENEYGKYLRICEQRKTGDVSKRMGSIIIPLEKMSDFVKELEKLTDAPRIKQLLKQG